MASRSTHAVGIDTEAGFALALLLKVRKDVHASAIPPDEEGLGTPGCKRAHLLNLYSGIAVFPSVQVTCQ